ncbi:MAG: MBL fold metallo-hydrolase [Proteobacteria bacterium]|nr:MBL fold metallo-hydrolase [Pseudomonadota bacterium]
MGEARSRRDVLLTALAAGAAGAVQGRALAAPPPADAKLTLLGTSGGPRVGKLRANACELIVAHGKTYVIDCGYGVTRQLIAADIDPAQVGFVLLSNCQGEHVVELGPLLYNSWMASRGTPVHVYGPPPLRRMLRAYFQSLAQDIALRVDEEGRPDITQLVKVHEFDRSGTVLQDDGLKISAVKVRHPPVLSSFAYRFETRTRAVVLSGATRYSPELAAFARGADVLAHEVMHVAALDRMLARVRNAPGLRKRLMAGHTNIADVGRAAAEAEVRTLVLTRFIPGDDQTLTEDMWIADIKKSGFNGRVLVGRDLMSI